MTKRHLIIGSASWTQNRNLELGVVGIKGLFDNGSMYLLSERHQGRCPIQYSIEDAV